MVVAQHVRLRWSVAEAEGLLDGLTKKATRLAGEETGWANLLRARALTGIPLRRMIDAVGQGALTLAFLPQGGIRDLRVRLPDIEPMKSGPEPQDSRLFPATAFGISLGIKDKRRFKSLVMGGHTPATRKRHERTGVENLYMTPDDIAAFHRRFVTISTLAVESGRAIPAVRAALKGAGVSAYSPDGQDFGRIFLRNDAVKALSRKS